MRSQATKIVRNKNDKKIVVKEDEYVVNHGIAFIDTKGVEARYRAGDTIKTSNLPTNILEEYLQRNDITLKEGK